MNTIHLEKQFETDIVAHLTGYAWVEGDCKADYDVPLALCSKDAIQWVKTAHKAAWEKLVSQHGAKSEEYFLSRLCTELDQLGTLHVLRHGFKIAGAGGTYFSMMQSKPRSGRNPDAEQLYQQNTLRIIRQVFYSANNQNSIDLVAFVNGLPVATLELKTESTQSVWAAIKQYKKDRLPKDQITNRHEPLLPLLYILIILG